MEQKAYMASIETGRLDDSDPGIRGRDHTDVLTDHVAPTKRPLLPPLPTVWEGSGEQFCPLFRQGVVFQIATLCTRGQ